jgi:tRNA uridine 5-carbamoylmethylation protein Kti12
MPQHHTTQKDLSKVLQPYEHKWVALSPDYTQVITSGETLRETAAQVRAEEKERVVFHKVLPYSML